MNELAKGWKTVLIDEVTEVISGGTPKSTAPEYYTEEHGDAIAWVTPADLSGYKKQTISHGRRSITNSGYESCSAKLMPKGSVLFSSRAPVGYVVIADNEISTNQGFKSFVPYDGVDSQYLYYYLKSIKHLAESLATGTTFKELSGKVAKTLPFPLAPLAEQKRIVDKLDEVLAQVDTIKARLDGIPDLLKRFRQSVLASAVSGKLTEEWRESNFDGESAQRLKAKLSVSRFDFWKQEQLEKFKSKGKLPKSDKWKEKYKPVIFVKSPELGTIPESWEWSSLEELSIVISDGDHNPPKKTSEGVRHLTVKNVNNGEISFEGCAYVSESGYAQTKLRYEAKTNDILLTCIGTVGRVAIVGEDTNFSTDRNLAYIRLYDALDVKYMKFLLMSPMMQRFMSGGKVGNAQSALYLKVIRALPTPLAPLEEQKEIVRLVDQYFTFADTIEAQVKKAQARVDNLTQSILAKAFRGELVAQDPNDEPADKLLERIAEARKEAEALAKAAKKAEAARKKAAKSA